MFATQDSLKMSHFDCACLSPNHGIRFIEDLDLRADQDPIYIDVESCTGPRGCIAEIAKLHRSIGHCICGTDHVDADVMIFRISQLPKLVTLLDDWIERWGLPSEACTENTLQIATDYGVALEVFYDVVDDADKGWSILSLQYRDLRGTFFHKLARCWSRLLGLQKHVTKWTTFTLDISKIPKLRSLIVRHLADVDSGL